MNSLTTKLLEERRILVDRSYYGAILWCHGVDIVRRDERCRARHILHNNIWPAWDMRAHVRSHLGAGGLAGTQSLEGTGPLSVSVDMERRARRLAKPRNGRHGHGA